MTHTTEIAGIELVTGLSYLLILIGFALRNVVEGNGARLLWPWMLVSIFGVCGVTRLDYVGLFNFPELLEIGSHLTLAAVSLAYGVGQLIYAFWPELFEQDTALPMWATPEDETAGASPAEVCFAAEKITVPD